MNKFLLWLSGSAAALLALGIHFYLQPLDPGLIAVQLTYSQAAFETLVTQWDGAQLERFRHHFTADYCFIVAYAGFGWQLGTRLAAAATTSRWWLPLLRWLLPMAGGFDVCENMAQLFLLRLHVFNLKANVYLLAGVSATLKWLLVLLFIGMLLRVRALARTATAA